ncbi:hypothetical protein E2I00_009184 [Balaenoptera physalus]|uniref:Uncharacterized protein n=1 Tax=Balaenoptera physalus TaxID=9770 RepID=A0A643BRX8_BALPH|nr:hypothetical protein E2I00_009184 [Balaenoptera physalus]
MDRKHGKYVVNIEHSENPAGWDSTNARKFWKTGLPVMCSNDQEAQSSAFWCPPSSDITGDVPSNLTGVCMNPRVLAHSG